MQGSVLILIRGQLEHEPVPSSLEVFFLFCFLCVNNISGMLYPKGLLHRSL